MLIALMMLALSHAPSNTMFADYVLNVPIRIENMRNVTSASLSCGIYHFGSTTLDRQDLTTPGTGQVNVPVTNGGYTGTITVTASVSAANALRYTPNHWSCRLTYRWLNPDGTTFNESLSAAERAAAYTRITGQEVSENTVVVEGDLP